MLATRKLNIGPLTMKHSKLEQLGINPNNIYSIDATVYYTNVQALNNTYNAGHCLIAMNNGQTYKIILKCRYGYADAMSTIADRLGLDYNNCRQLRDSGNLNVATSSAENMKELEAIEAHYISLGYK